MQPHIPSSSTSPELTTGDLPPVPRSPFERTVQQEADKIQATENYREFRKKSENRPWLVRSALDPVNGIELKPGNPLHQVIKDLLDAPVVQRMRQISQLSVGSWVYPDAVQPRFGHVLGCAHLTAQLLTDLYPRVSGNVQKQIERYGKAVVAYALTHDLGHIAPGSHVAQWVWFPDNEDAHEKISTKIIQEDQGFRATLTRVLGERGAEDLDYMVLEDDSVPRWTWQMITGGGWNTDRGDWVARDGHFAGVKYGDYDLAVIKKYLTISDDGEFAIEEGGVNSLESFFRARADMYRVVYGHETCKIAEQMLINIGRRARELYRDGLSLPADPAMQAVLSAKNVEDLSLSTVLRMTEYWASYHMDQWSTCEDLTLRELSTRVLIRDPFKRFPYDENNHTLLHKLVSDSGLDPEYFLCKIEPKPINLAKDLRNAINVKVGDRLVPLTEHSETMEALNKVAVLKIEPFLAAPVDCFKYFRTH